MSDFVDSLIVRICTERMKRLNIKREKCFVGIDLGRDRIEEILEELKNYKYEGRELRPSGEIQGAVR